MCTFHSLLLTHRTHDEVEVVRPEDPGVAAHAHHQEGLDLLHADAVLLILVKKQQNERLHGLSIILNSVLLFPKPKDTFQHVL